MSAAVTAWDRRKFWGQVISFVVLGGSMWFTVWMMQRLDPTREKREKGQAKKVLNRLQKPGLELTDHEAQIAAEVIDPRDIKINFKDVGGLEHITEHLSEAVIYPLVHPELFASSAGLFGPPKGVLLMGPPGCGKTMLAKALAKESNATFINIKASTIQSKWYGEGVRLVDALFSLARKLQPSIIFIDEIDSFMRERGMGDHEVSNAMKAEFMSSWDGLLTDNSVRIMVLGATNRAHDIDAAILRRMPKRFEVKLPNTTQRKSILTLMLKDIKLEPGFDFDRLASRTAGLSGSDLKEACRNAAMVPVREVMRSKAREGQMALQRAKEQGFTIRALRQDDFLQPDEPAPASKRHNSSAVAFDRLD